MSLTEREYSQAYEAGRAARRGGKRIGDCPFRGRTEKIAKLSDAWCRGFKDQDDELKARRSAGAPA